MASTKRRVLENVIVTNLPNSNNILPKGTRKKLKEIRNKVTGFKPVRLHELLTKQYGANKYRLQKFKNNMYVEIPISTDVSDLDFLVAYEHERIILNEQKPQKSIAKNTVAKESKTKATNIENYINFDESVKVNKKKVKSLENEAKPFNPIREPPQNTLASLKTVWTPTADSLISLGNKKPTKLKRTLNLTNRDTNLVKKMKALYDNTCQVCGEKIQIGLKMFASEVHHIRPLGKHNGSDTSDNAIVLCPNHHLMFDRGAITIDITNKKVYHIDSINPIHEKKLMLIHELNEKNIAFHNENIFGKTH
ncbi:HNH endonuclease [Bacillus sp. FJAT-29953]|nr:HNH endonuclease [Bacillus sp. FJAT-29953]